MSRIFKVVVNLDDMCAELDTLPINEHASWMSGFRCGCRGKVLDTMSGPMLMGAQFGLACYKSAEAFRESRVAGGKARHSKDPKPTESSTCSAHAQHMQSECSAHAQHEAQLSNSQYPIDNNQEANIHAPAEADLFDPVTTATPAPKTDADRWRYEIALEPWAKSIKVAGGKIGPDNWTVWQGVLDRIFRNDCNALLEVMAKLPAGERWPDRVEEESWQGPDGKVARIAQDRQETAKMLRARIIKIRGGECYLKSDEMVKAACQYGLESLDALAKHAKDIGADLSKDLARVWYAGRPSAYNGWDFYEPKKKLDTPLTIEQLSQSLKGE